MLPTDSKLALHVASIHGLYSYDQLAACAHVTSKQLRLLLHTTGSGKAWLKVDLWL